MGAGLIGAVAARPVALRVEGVVLVLLGVAALVLPLAAGLAAGLIFGWILILSGVFGLFAAFSGRAHSHMGWSLVSAVIALAVGVALLLHPVAGAVGLTILLGAYLFVDGLALLGLAFDQRRRGVARWGWLAASGALDIVLAGFILVLTGPGAIFLVGVIIGIDLIAAGLALLFVHALPRASIPV